MKTTVSTTHQGCLVHSSFDQKGDEHVILTSPMQIDFTLAVANDPKIVRMGKLWPHGIRLAMPVLPSLLRRQAE